MKIVGVDLFAGAGGLSLGAEMAGIDVRIAVENDVYAAQKYSLQGTTQSRYLTGGVPPVRFSM